MYFASADPVMVNRSPAVRLLVVMTALSSGCATVAQHRWMPSAAEWRHAAVVAARDPDTWAPALAAVAVGVSGTDHRISKWASDETPLFGSQKNAQDASNITNGALHVMMLATALAPDASGDPFSKRLMTAIENELVTLPNDFATPALKDAVGRERPDASNDASFPSGHSSTAASYATVTERNAEDLRASNTTRRTIDLTARLLVATTAWARVEGKKHYPTDVLAGAAIGNMLTTFFDRALRDRKPGDVHLDVQLSSHSFGVMFAFGHPSLARLRGAVGGRD